MPTAEVPQRGAVVTRADNASAQPVCACRRNAASPECPTAPGAAKKRWFRPRTRGAAAWALPSIALALVPKCPMCIAAYLAVGGGLGVSFTTVAHLRTALVWLCWSVLLLLAVRLAIRLTLPTHTATEAR